MGERVWGYTVKGFEMTSLSSKLTSLLELSPAGDFSFIGSRPFFHPRKAWVALPEELDWCKARPICRLRASRFAIGGGTCRTCATCRTFSSSGIGLGEVCMGQGDVIGLWNWLRVRYNVLLCLWIG